MTHHEHRQKLAQLSAEDRKAVKAMRAILHQQFPLAFVGKQAKKNPLKIGIHRDLLARCEDLSTVDLLLALTDYTSGPRYARAMVEGAMRVDLDGEPSGPVEARHVIQYARYLKWQEESLAQKNGVEVRISPLR